MLKKRLRWFIARGLHLFPFRTEKLNLVAPMVLRKRESRSPPPSEESLTDTIRGAFSFLGEMGEMGLTGSKIQLVQLVQLDKLDQLDQLD